MGGRLDVDTQGLSARKWLHTKDKYVEGKICSCPQNSFQWLWGQGQGTTSVWESEKEILEKDFCWMW